MCVGKAWVVSWLITIITKQDWPIFLTGCIFGKMWNSVWTNDKIYALMIEKSYKTTLLDCALISLSNIWTKQQRLHVLILWNFNHIARFFLSLAWPDNQDDIFFHIIAVKQKIWKLGIFEIRFLNNLFALILFWKAFPEVKLPLKHSILILRVLLIIQLMVPGDMG